MIMMMIVCEGEHEEDDAAACAVEVKYIWKKNWMMESMACFINEIT